MSPDRKKCLVYRRAAVEQRRVCRNRRKPSRIYANGFNQRFFFQDTILEIVILRTHTGFVNVASVPSGQLCLYVSVGLNLPLVLTFLTNATFWRRNSSHSEKPFGSCLVCKCVPRHCSHSSDAGQMSSKRCPPCVTATKNKPAHITEATSFSVCWAHHTVANASQLCCCETGCTHAAQMCSWWMSLGFEFWVQSLRD